jgi:hypothetical protein
VLEKLLLQQQEQIRRLEAALDDQAADADLVGRPRAAS